MRPPALPVGDGLDRTAFGHGRPLRKRHAMKLHTCVLESSTSNARTATSFWWFSLFFFIDGGSKSTPSVQKYKDLLKIFTTKLHTKQNE